MSIISRSSVSTQLRIALAIVTIVCILGALVPDSELIPFRKALEASRTVQAATQAMRWLFLSGAVLCGVAFAAWHWIERGVAAGIKSVTRWSDRAFWGVVCGLALGLRLPVLLLLPLPLRSDGLWYHTTAMAMAEGRGLQAYGVPTAYRPPGYSTLLAITYRLFGSHPEWAWFWGIASSAVILFTTYGIAERLYDKTTARIATLIIASYPALILYSGLPLSDLVFTAGLMLVCYMVVLYPPYRWPLTVGIGLALGLLTLTRGVSIGFILVVPLLWFIKQSDVRKLLLHFTLLTCVFAACLTPWVLRNYSIFGTPTLGTNIGMLLHMGNNANASGSYDITVLPTPLKARNLQLNEAQIDRIYLQAAINFILAHPDKALSILPKKVTHLMLLEVSAAQTLLQDRPPWFKYTAYGVTQIFYVPILILFLLRLINLRDPATRPHGMQWIGLGVVAYFTLIAMVFIGDDRYRLPFLPWMIIESSVVVAWLKSSMNHNEVRERAESRPT